MKSKQELKKVFENGDKPRQEDFWEWQDSYWHKEEAIPKEKIENIPFNMATVDVTTETENIEGNVNTKEQVDEKITNAINSLKNNVPEAYDTLKEIADWISNDETAEAGILQAIQNETTARINADSLKLDKPATIGSTTSYPYVVGDDGNGGSARLPAEDLGKNFFNSDLSNTSARNHTMNAAVTVNTLGNAYKVQNLPDRSTDSNFNKVIKTDSTGQFALGDAFVYNVPNTITVNHVNQPSDTDVPVYVQTIKDKLNEIHNSAIFQKFTNWNIETFNGISDETINIQNNDTIQTNVNPFRSLTTAVGGQTMINVKSSKILSSNQNWAITFNVLISSIGDQLYNNYGVPGCRWIGIYSDSGELIVPDFYFKDMGGDYNNSILGLSGDNMQSISTRQIGWSNSFLKCVILKVGTQIFLQASCGTNYIISRIYDIQNLVNNNSNFGFVVSAYKLTDNNNPHTAYSANVSNIQYALLT